jgi:hypothetical protein
MPLAHAMRHICQRAARKQSEFVRCWRRSAAQAYARVCRGAGTLMLLVARYGAFHKREQIAPTQRMPYFTRGAMLLPEPRRTSRPRCRADLCCADSPAFTFAHSERSPRYYHNIAPRA